MFTEIFEISRFRSAVSIFDFQLKLINNELFKEAYLVRVRRNIIEYFANKIFVFPFLYLDCFGIAVIVSYKR